MEINEWPHLGAFNVVTKIKSDWSSVKLSEIWLIIWIPLKTSFQVCQWEHAMSQFSCIKEALDQLGMIKTYFLLMTIGVFHELTTPTIFCGISQSLGMFFWSFFIRKNMPCNWLWRTLSPQLRYGGMFLIIHHVNVGICSLNEYCPLWWVMYLSILFRKYTFTH